MRTLITVILLLSYYSSTAQGRLEIIQGRTGTDAGMIIVESQNDGYLLFTNTDSYGAGMIDIRAIRLTDIGDTLWDVTYGGTADDEVFHAINTSDGGYLFCGYTSSKGAGNQDGWLVKTDSSGIIVWDSTYGGTDNDRFRQFTTLTNGDMVFGGDTRSTGAGAKDIWLVKTDSTGAEIWQKDLGGTKKEAPVGIHQTHDGGFMLLSTTKSVGAGDNDFWLTKHDANGDSVWTKTFGTSKSDIAFSFTATPDSGFILLGTFNNAQDTAQLTAIRVDSAGNQVWMKNPARSIGDLGTWISASTNGGYWICGSTSNRTNGSDILIMKINDAGDTTATFAVGNTTQEIAEYIGEDSNGDIMIAGRALFFDPSDVQAYAMVTDNVSNIPCPKVLDFTKSTDTLCPGEALSLKADYYSSQTHDWFVEDVFSTSGSEASIIPDSTGDLMVHLVVCSDTVSEVVHVVEAPSPFTVELSDTLTYIFTMDPGISPSWFKWNFGDSSSLDSVNRDPSHTYDAPGAYNIRLDLELEPSCEFTQSDSTQPRIPGSIEQLSQIKFDVFPNPSSEPKIYFKKGIKVDQVEVYDLLGKKVNVVWNRTEASVSFKERTRGQFIISIRSGGRYGFSQLSLH